MSFIRSSDPELWASLQGELYRQRHKLEMIASENFVSSAVLEAGGTVLTNKYAEGYPGRRYYGGCEFVDQAEDLAVRRAKELFSCEYANVQPHSGSQANMGVISTLLKPGDTLMGMDLSAGGHLTHGSPVNFSGLLYRVVRYGVSEETELIDYDEVRRKALEARPKLIIAGASSYSRFWDFKRFREIADEVGAYLMTDMAHIAGLVAAGLHPSPVEHSHFVTSTTHKTLRGPRGGLILMGRDRENDLGVTAPKSGRTKNFSELIDGAIFPGIQGGPLMHIIAGKAAAFKEALSPDFITYQKQVVANARALAAALMSEGVKVLTGGTDNHLVLLNVSDSFDGLSGKKAEKLLEDANITSNKNAVPFDKKSPFITSGIRLGTPALTSRGLKEKEMEEIAGYLTEILRKQDEAVCAAIKKKVRALCGKFPLYPELGEVREEDINFPE